MRFLIPLFVLFCVLTCNNQNESTQEVSESAHQPSEENFTVNRLIILNEKGEMLMTKEQWVWAPPSFLFNKRQFVQESLDSLANAYGVKIAEPKLHGQFAFKYDYQPYATYRNFYVAQYVSGDVIVPKGMDEAKWMPASEAIEINSVIAIKQITEQILKYPDVVWGGSFMVSHVGDDHPTKQVEAFYPLFGSNDTN